eukprot:15365053-Ditylum_brightwellii.AAC.1
MKQDKDIKHVEAVGLDYKDYCYVNSVFLTSYDIPILLEAYILVESNIQQEHNHFAYVKWGNQYLQQHHCILGGRTYWEEKEQGKVHSYSASPGEEEMISSEGDVIN